MKKRRVSTRDGQQVGANPKNMIRKRASQRRGRKREAREEAKVSVTGKRFTGKRLGGNAGISWVRAEK